MQSPHTPLTDSQLVKVPMYTKPLKQIDSEFWAMQSWVRADLGMDPLVDYRLVSRVVPESIISDPRGFGMNFSDFQWFAMSSRSKFCQILAKMLFQLARTSKIIP